MDDSTRDENRSHRRAPAQAGSALRGQAAPEEVLQKSPARAAELRDLHIDERPIDSLKPRRGNPRVHSAKQIRQIADSIRTFGFTNPLLIDATGTVIAGHGRLRAAKQLGMATVPTIRLDHLSKEQVRALVIADNKLAELAGWVSPFISSPTGSSWI